MSTTNLQFILIFVIIIYMNSEFIEKYQELKFHNCCFIEDNVDKNDYIIVYKITTSGTKEIIVGWINKTKGTNTTYFILYI